MIKMNKNILIILAILVLLLVGYCIYLQYNSNAKLTEKFYTTNPYINISQPLIGVGPRIKVF